MIGADCVVVMSAKKQFDQLTKPFSTLPADVRKPPLVIHLPTTRRTAPPNWRRQMRTISFILAFAFILAGPSMAGSTDGSLPGIGAFSYSGSPLATHATQIVASR